VFPRTNVQLFYSINMLFGVQNPISGDIGLPY
jgi:hypothetical protein